ncbi:crotonobetainyl-CoA:carnitine CoA-transferase CaiB-like acyl-CoA transferase [Neorhizobium galegae]|uniref:CoA transferase n=1 Tax=Neorhizobium galegae TaxID=399 RepID=UPI001AE5D6EE|nr:CoA transferase [Neorhizobium galegae]MBP2562291.1 crotonobetainyl-CoA:carnitine CoA-transferase CaiB-like acyl-CoA transferase [Neorhizobium galegae]MDQ0138330.1 crotonobetainyl-CoA:carnitine CoA-transferase CaiB-like acyl-CoA transferase [Neorhizobium galegae]
MSYLAKEALADLLARIGMSSDASPGSSYASVEFTGADPVVPSRYRPGLASAVALAANAVGISEIWRMRGGRTQSIGVDLRRAAVPGLRTVSYLRRDGHPLQLLRPASEDKVFFETADGRRMYLLRHAFYHEHFSRLLAFLDCSSTTESIERAVSRWRSDDLEEALAEAKAIGAIARTQDEWLGSPQGRHLASRTPVEIEKIGDGPAMPFEAGDRPLSGIRVVDMGHVLAGPVVSRQLAEQGADVLHISAPHQPDPTHIVVDTGLGKRSAFVNLDSPGELERFRELVAGSDVFAHSWRPGSLDSRGLSPQALAKLRPGIIYVSVSCYGYDGPWASRAGYDPLGQVVSGLAVGEGSIDRPQLASTFTLNDYLAGYLGAAGVTSALLRRAREGGSYHVKVSLTSCSMWLQELGQLPREEWPDGLHGIRALPRPADDELTISNTAFGAIEHPLPIVRYSETPARWDIPPEPAGASQLTWG